MDKWKQVEDKVDKSGSGGGDFLKLEDKEMVTVAVLGEPETYMARPFREGDRPSPKVLLNVYVVSSKPPTLKIWDMSAPTFKDLVAVRSKFPFDKWLYSVTRNGIGKQTRYKVLPELEKPLSPEQQAHLRSLELRDLEELAARIEYQADASPVPPPTSPSSRVTAQYSDDALPF